MDRKNLLLACFAAANGEAYTPVQVQKIVFLFQQQAPDDMLSDSFKFKPYDYGPFDANVYACIEELATEGAVAITGEPFDKSRLYKLQPTAGDKAADALEDIVEPYRTFLVRLSEWARGLSFAELVGAVYRAYPDMRANSVFGG